MKRVLVTPRSLTGLPSPLLSPVEAAGYDLVFASPGRHPSEEELISLVPGCSGWLAGVEPIGARVFAAAAELKVISRNGTGVDSIDLAAARRHGVRILMAEGANAQAVAELTLALMLCGARRLLPSCIAVKSGRWCRREGREIGHATVGIIGCGAVGRAVARIVGGLGADVLAYDVAPDAGFVPSGRFAWCELDALLSRSDIVSLHCPALPDGAPLLDERRLRLLKPGAGLVNTARASLVDETGLLDALDAGRLGWFATDVFADEPPPASPLLAHPQVIATPHIGGLTAEGGREAVRVAVDNLLAALDPSAPALAHGAEAG